MDDRKNNLTEEICNVANSYGMRFIGPNCLGVFNNWYNPEDENSAFNIAIWEILKKGNFSIASQSGTLSSHIWFDPSSVDLGLSKSLSVGNEANIDKVDEFQLAELKTNAKLAKLANKFGVQVILESLGGHINANDIIKHVKLYKKLSNNRPLFVSGPLPIDTATGHDHI
ncbi:unnamed protein product, partial [marine sediment metagenome]